MFSQLESGYIRIDGRTNPEQRHHFCKKFQEKEKVRVAILSITAANAGLNLAAANLVLFAELFWNPGVTVWVFFILLISLQNPYHIWWPNG